MNTVLSLPPSTSLSSALGAASEPFLPAAWRNRILVLAGLYGLVCLFFGAVALSGGRDSTLGGDSWVVFVVLRLLGAGSGLWQLRQAGFSPRQPAHWMLLALSLSLLLGAVGSITWLGYNLRGVLVPYPSAADIGFGAHALLWAVGLFLFYVALETAPREEMGPFLGLLTATWSLTFFMLSLAQGAPWAAAMLPKLALNLYYPFMWALSCALVGSLVLGPRFKQLTGRWRSFAVVVYAGAVVLFLTNIAYAITAAVPAESPAAKYLYYNGGPLDFLFATGNFLLMVGLMLVPLGWPLYHTPPRALRQVDVQPPARTVATVSPAGRTVLNRTRTQRTQALAGRITPGRATGGHAGGAVLAQRSDSGGDTDQMWALLGALGALSAEVRALRQDLARNGHHPASRQQPHRMRPNATRSSRRSAQPGEAKGA
jgi:hypothetical protein